jgi:hypothetical protein
MTIGSAFTEEEFAGTGGQTAFVYTQQTDAAANVVVTIVDSNGTPTQLTNVTHYDLSGVGGTLGITVTYPRTSVTPVAPYNVTLTASEKIVIKVAPALTTTFGPKNNDTYSPGTLGSRIDYIYRSLQELEADVARCFHVPVGTANPVAATTAGILQSRVLLATDTQAAGTKFTLTAANWPATYDRVELEFIGVATSAALSQVLIEPIDGGTATTTNLRGQAIIVQSGSVTGESLATEWGTSASHRMSNAGDNAFTGSAKFTAHSTGFLSGTGSYTYQNGSIMYGTQCYYQRHTTAATTSWDGFDVKLNTGSITGKINLWGLPKQ